MNIRPILFSASCFALLSASAAAQTPGVLICRAKQCIEAKQTIGREGLFHQLAQLLDKNIGKNVSLCEADPTTHTCLTKGISFPIQSATIQTNISIPEAQVVDSKILPNTTGLDLILDYKIKAGDTFPQCQTALSRLGVAAADMTQLISPRFNCQLTETGNSVFSLVYNINYIDFDSGLIGAYFSAASGNSLSGGKNGYVLMHFSQPTSISADIFKRPSAQGPLTVTAEQAHTQMEAIWMKPTPFLNLETPVFMPENCMNDMGACSAQMLNTMPGTASISQTTPSPLPSTPGVASTTGLIQQTKTILPPSQALTQTVTTRKQVIEEGKPVYVEEEVRRFVQQTPDSPLVEDKNAAVHTSSGVQPGTGNAIPSRTEGNSEQATLESNASLTAPQSQNMAPLIIDDTVTRSIDSSMPNMTQPTSSGQNVLDTATRTESVNSGQGQGVPVSNNLETLNHNPALPNQPTVLVVPDMPKPAVLPNGTYTNGTPAIEIITPEGVTLTPAEQAYIQQMALPDEAYRAVGVGDVSVYTPDAQQTAPNTAFLPQAAVSVPVSGSAQTIPSPQPVVQPMGQSSGTIVNQGNIPQTGTPSSEPASAMAPQQEPKSEEKLESFWEKAEKYLYF